MGSPMPADHLPPDPYIALGLAKDATSAAIKTQYRKLALKFHPDKVTDEAQKGVAADQFHKIQTAYEIVGDEDRRARYDAQCKLAALRKEMMERGGHSKPHTDVRTAGYKMPTESARGGEFFARGPDRTNFSPQYEYRTPQYSHSPPDYFDIPRPAARKEPEYERSSKRAPPRDEREKPRSSPKENERSSRKEKSRRTERDIRRERETKKQQAYVTVEEDSDSESEYEQTRRRMRAEDEERKAREQYRESVRRQQEEAANGYYSNERAQKMFSQDSTAREYINQSAARSAPRERPESERRPSPVRATSSKDKVESIKRDTNGRPNAFRRDSGRPKTTGRDTDKKSSSRAKETKPIEIVDEPQTRRAAQATQPPPFTHSKSSPADIRPPFERQRSQSVEEQHNVYEQIAGVKRSETMPQQQPNMSKSYDSRRNQSSKLRAEVRDGYLTPERSPEPQGRKTQYGQTYADDDDLEKGFHVPKAQADSYRTEVREPERATRQTRVTRSPSPMKEQRGRQRTGSAQHAAPPQAPPMPRTSSYTYRYNGNGQGVQEYTRPAPSRENSGRGELFGEIGRESRSPRQHQSKYSPPPAEQTQYARHVRPEDIKYQTGYSTSKRTGERGFGRTNSSQKPVYAN